jgi:hypothetical protein
VVGRRLDLTEIIRPPSTSFATADSGSSKELKEFPLASRLHFVVVLHGTADSRRSVAVSLREQRQRNMENDSANSPGFIVSSFRVRR